MPLRVDRTIYSNEKLGKGFYVYYKERDKDYKLIIKRVNEGNLFGKPIYYESLPKSEGFKNYFQFVVKTIEDNIKLVENMYYWQFGKSIFKHLLQNRS